MRESELLYNTEVAQVAMGHTRKASTGYAVNLKNAQPCLVKDESGNIIYCVTHNGTIYNIDDLAKKHIPEIDVKGMTDSQILTLIMFHKGYDVLEEYEGKAALVITDYRSGVPETFFFKGMSKEYKSSKPEEERPLFYTLDDNYGEIVYSSIINYLFGLRPDLTVYTLTPNILYKFVGTGLAVVKNINRENAFSKKQYAVQTTYVYQGNVNVNTKTTTTASSFYDKYIEVDEDLNIYSNKNANLNGKSLITRHGKLEYIKNANNYELWFYNGICMLNEQCWKFLVEYRKELGITIPEFILRYENLIRFLSMDGVYKKGNLWLQATSPIDCHTYSGKLRFLGQVQGLEIKSGYKIRDVIGNLWKSEDFEFTIPTLDFQKIKEECRSLTK